jgi:hypothetical protein
VETVVGDLVDEGKKMAFVAQCGTVAGYKRLLKLNITINKYCDSLRSST